MADIDAKAADDDAKKVLDESASNTLIEVREAVEFLDRKIQLTGGEGQLMQEIKAASSKLLILVGSSKSGTGGTAGSTVP